MRILCISDILADYGAFDPAVMPEADICIVAGNVTQYGLSRHSSDEMGYARTWLGALGQHYPTFVIPGIHDIGVRNSDFGRIAGVTPVLNSHAGYGNLKIYGVSMTPAHHFPRMATMFDHMTSDPHEENESFLFDPVDIVISHAPPYGYLDRVRGKDGTPAGGPHVGSAALLRYIERNKPKLVVCGHIQGDSGIKTIGQTTIINAAKSIITTDLSEIDEAPLAAAA
jgi:Icc-related predicted phosphoesterase